MAENFIGPDGQSRCGWCGGAPEFLNYHDHEWGFPSMADNEVFEKLCLESFQSGLSWRTILNKRDNFRKAFHNFDIDKIARFNQSHVKRLLQDEGIVRHRGKIEALINNAGCAHKTIQEHGSLAAFFWQYQTSNKTKNGSTSDESIALAKVLKKMGWKFVGPTTVYAFMQAMGLVNDHSETCIIRNRVERARQDYKTAAGI